MKMHSHSRLIAILASIVFFAKTSLAQAIGPPDQCTSFYTCQQFNATYDTLNASKAVGTYGKIKYVGFSVATPNTPSYAKGIRIYPESRPNYAISDPIYDGSVAPNMTSQDTFFSIEGFQWACASRGTQLAVPCTLNITHRYAALDASNPYDSIIFKYDPKKANNITALQSYRGTLFGDLSQSLWVSWNATGADGKRVSLFLDDLYYYVGHSTTSG